MTFYDKTYIYLLNYLNWVTLQIIISHLSDQLQISSIDNIQTFRELFKYNIFKRQLRSSLNYFPSLIFTIIPEMFFFFNLSFFFFISIISKNIWHNLFITKISFYVQRQVSRNSEIFIRTKAML